MHTIEQYIEHEIISRYHTFDEAHNMHHVRAVVEESIHLATLYHEDALMAYVIAAYHDVGIVYGREFHHEHSARILKEDKVLLQWFAPWQIVLMSEAVADHRASARSKPRSIYGCIVADADRDLDTRTVILRTMQYGKKHYPQYTREQMYERTLAHLHEKYAEGGYMNLCLHKGKAPEQLRQLRAVIADRALLLQYFNELYTHL